MYYCSYSCCALSLLAMAYWRSFVVSVVLAPVSLGLLLATIFTVPYIVLGAFEKREQTGALFQNGCFSLR